MQTVKRGMLMAALVSGTAAVLVAADRTWDGEGGDGLWDTAANWSGDTVPGAADRAIITTAGVPADKRIRLRGDKTILQLAFSGAACDTIVDGEGSNTLTLVNGTIGGTGSGAVKGVVACDVILGASGSVSGPDSFLSTIFCYGKVTDGGNGYGSTFVGTQNRSVVIGGAWDIGGPLTINCRTARIGGVYTNADDVALYGGSVTNATGVYLDGRLSDSDNETTLTIENLYQADSDRIRGATALGSLRSGGRVILNGHATDGVYERIAKLDMQAGRLSLTAAGKTATVATDLIIESVERASGSALAIGASAGGRVIVEGATNTNGMWKPWCFINGYYSKVDSSNALIATVNADYLAADATGSDPSKLYRFSTDELTLAEPSSMWGLRVDGTMAQTLDLGVYDLTIGSGSMIVVGSNSKTIRSGGGRLVFGGEDVLFDVEGSGAFTISAPLAWSKPAGSEMVRPSLVFSRGRRTENVILEGEDQIGEYQSLFNYGYYSAMRTLVLGGPSDRTFHGPVAGYFALEKQGPGTLTFKGPNDRRGGGFTVKEGRVVLAHPNAPAPTVMTNASCEVAEGITLSGVRITVLTNGTLRGLWTTAAVTLRAGARVAPGNKDVVGTLTLATHTYLPTNTVLAVRLNAVTNDLLRVSGNLTLPPNGERLVVEVSDTTGGTVAVKGKSYVVAMWTGTDPATSPAWEVTTATPSLLDVSEAVVTVDKTGNKIVLTGLKPARRGTLIGVL